MDPNVSLTLSKRADETLWGKAISGIGRIVYSSSFNIYMLLIAAKRSSVLRAFNNFNHVNDYKDESKREQICEKYKKSYSNYVNTIEKYIVENIYTKVQKGAATFEEESIISKYFEVCKYKNTDQVLYRTKLEKLALSIDWNTVQTAKSESFIERYKEFYLYTIEEAYKAEMRHDSILLANAKEGDRDQYEAIYSLIDSYIKEVLPILPENANLNKIIKDHRKYVAAIDSYDKKDFLELRKRLALLSFTKDLFEFSFPLVAKEQCYKEIIEVARIILTNYYTDAEKFAAYEVILDAIEEYVENVLDYKTTWDKEADKKSYEKFSEKLSILKKLARIDYDGYKNQREVLFIKYDLEQMNAAKIKLPEVRDYYRERLIIRRALRELKKKARVIGGTWRSKRRLAADDIKNLELSQSPIERIVNDIKNIIEAQIELKNIYAKSEVASIETVTQNDEVSQTDFVEETNESTDAKPIFNVMSYLLNGGKKYKKRKAL
ncbi:MAG: hypothetical protein IKI57_05805 [Clostridia bacterium]|nr:hypothetical protein [Clostridia bacterium]